MQKRGLVIFDLDGTLFQTVKVSVPAVQSALRAAGYEPPSEETVRSFFGRPPDDFYNWVYTTFPGSTEATVRSIDEWELRLVRERGELYPGIRELLTDLRATTEHLAICSNGPGAYVMCVLDTLGLTPLFDVVRWLQDGDPGKPGMVAELLTRLSGRPGLVIGDRADDIEAAHENGLYAIASGYGYGKPGELDAADATAHTPAELAGLIAGVLG
jgi:phosphoglycolate phosphatase